MWWQNASARTVATASPLGVRPQDSSCSTLTVVAPSRCLQNDAKSCCPRRSIAASFIRATSNGRGQASTCPRTSGSTAAGESATR